MKKSYTRSSLGMLCIAGFLSGCGGSDDVPILASSGPTAGVEEQRALQQSDDLTSQEAALISQAESEPIPTPLPDL